VIGNSTRRAGRLSLRLNDGDETASPFLEALKTAGFKAGDRVVMTLEDA